MPKALQKTLRDSGDKRNTELQRETGLEKKEEVGGAKRKLSRLCRMWLEEVWASINPSTRQEPTVLGTVIRSSHSSAE